LVWPCSEGRDAAQILTAKAKRTWEWKDLPARAVERSAHARVQRVNVGAALDQEHHDIHPASVAM
jgi:hypothetical protein